MATPQLSSIRNIFNFSFMFHSDKSPQVPGRRALPPKKRIWIWSRPISRKHPQSILSLTSLNTKIWEVSSRLNNTSIICIAVSCSKEKSLLPFFVRKIRFVSSNAQLQSLELQSSAGYVHLIEDVLLAFLRKKFNNFYKQFSALVKDGNLQLGNAMHAIDYNFTVKINKTATFFTV